MAHGKPVAEKMGTLQLVVLRMREFAATEVANDIMVDLEFTSDFTGEKRIASVPLTRVFSKLADMVEEGIAELEEFLHP